MPLLMHIFEFAEIYTICLLWIAGPLFGLTLFWTMYRIGLIELVPVFAFASNNSNLPDGSSTYSSSDDDMDASQEYLKNQLRDELMRLDDEYHDDAAKPRDAAPKASAEDVAGAHEVETSTDKPGPTEMSEEPNASNSKAQILGEEKT